MSVLILAEHDQQQIKPNLLNVVTAAQQLAEPVDILIVGHQCQPVAQQAANIVGVRQVFVADDPCYEFMLAENTAKLLQHSAKDYDAIICAASQYGKNVMPRLAALLDVAQISDVIAINEDKSLVRPIYAGNALETLQSLDNKLVLTVRSTAFNPANSHDQACEIIPVEESIAWDKTEFIKQELTESERPELTNARVVISGGRGLQNGENFQLLEQLADKLGAAIGASRAAVDAGFVPNDYQVGQTGKVVAPELYIAIGISGAIQHVAGMKDSKVIVAINKDEDAPIFNYADYGLVGDLFDIVPEFINQLD